MKRVVLSVLMVLALASPAFAINGVGDISIYGDPAGNDCNLTAPASGIWQTVYVVHKFLAGEESTGARFKIVVPAEVTVFAFTTSFAPTGNVLTDISVGYGSCITTTTSLGNLVMQVNAPIPACSYFSVRPDDFTLTAQATDCVFEQHDVGVGQAIVNPNAGCQCNIKTQQSTWGKVKSLYR